jgi:hypothetical protein
VDAIVDEPTRNKGGRPKGSTKRKPGDKPITLILSPAQADYLGWLVDKTKLGHSIEVIALRLLTDKIEEMSPSDVREPKPGIGS